jgi:hypothetical protein
VTRGLAAFRADAVVVGHGIEEDPIGAHPHHDLDGQVPQEPGQARAVVTGVRHDQHRRVADLPVSGVEDAAQDLAELGGGDGRGVGTRFQALCVQQGRPGGRALFQGGDEDIRCG